MGNEWYINGWGRDNMEYWLPARAGCQCSILYTTKCNLNAILRHLAAAAGFADNEDEGVISASITEALRDDHLVIWRDATAQCPEIAWAVEKADAIQAFLHSSTTGIRIPEPAPTRTGITPVNRLYFSMSEGSGKVQIA
jgi:hypothetical protein